MATFGGVAQPPVTGDINVPRYTGKTVTSYEANFAKVTDQVGKVRRTMIDGLGRLARVDEPDENGNLGSTSLPAVATNYAYNSLGNLISVTQGTQPARTFSYDSIPRLRGATNPESGSSSYTYDDNGNLQSKTDGRSITTNYVYDGLNRVTGVSYQNDPNSTAAVTYNYDSTSISNGKGRLASVSSSLSTYSYSGYDATGKVTGGSQTLGSQTYTMTYGYNLAGQLKSITYPSLRTVNYGYDNAGRLNSFNGNLGDNTQRNYATGITYDAASRVTQEQFGTTVPIYNKLFYNSRGQLSEIREGLTPNNTTWERGAIINHYSDNCWGMCAEGSPGNGVMPDNNGNLKQQDHWIQDSSGQVSAIFVQRFEYDTRNRLRRAYDGTNWQQQYSYDRWGNRCDRSTKYFRRRYS